jgi:YHS domain-containing protein
MSTHNLRLGIVVAAALIPSLAWAQHDADQPASTQAPSAELTQCLRVQPVIANIITAATSRAESARLSNSPTEMRAAVESLEAALRDIRAQSAPCSTAAASTDPHAGHALPTTQPSAAAPPAQVPTGAADPHAGHTMPGAAPASKGTTTPKPAAAKPAPSKPKQGAADPHAGHTTPSAAPATKTAPAAAKPEGAKPADPHAAHSVGQPQGDKQRDPVNGLLVDPATAPKTTYQGQTYYFSSEQSLKEFLANPAKFAKKPRG